MARSNRLIILVGVVLAVVVFIGIVAFLGGQAPANTALQTRPVLVATEDIEVGEQVTPAKVQIKDVPAEAVSGTPMADPSLVGSRLAVFAVAQGQQVNQETFGRTGPGTLDITGQLRPGEKAISFMVDRVSGLDFVVQQGDMIDIVLTVDIDVFDVDPDTGQPRAVEGLDTVRTVKTVLQAKRVLYVSATRVQPAQTEEEQSEEQAAPTESVIIIFAGTNQDAELMRFAQRDTDESQGFRRISVTLRSGADTATESTDGITLDRLMERYGVPVPSVIIPPESQLNQ